jgi:gas vesicle protein
MLAYLDAATGSMIVSAIAGGAAGLSVAGKMGMKRLKGKITRSDGDAAESVSESVAEEITATADASS